MQSQIILTTDKIQKKLRKIHIPEFLLDFCTVFNFLANKVNRFEEITAGSVFSMAIY